MICWCRFLSDCKLVGSFCYRCRWNRLKLFCIKPRFTSHFDVVGLQDIFAGSCKLCGKWQEKKHQIRLRKKKNYDDVICIECAKIISQIHPDAIYGFQLNEYIKELKK